LDYRIPIAKPSIGRSEVEAAMKAVSSGWISSKGPFVREFESEFANYIGRKRSVSTSNGTGALHLALLAVGIGPKDEVIVPTLTFVATANSVVYTGAKPVFADSHPDYWCIDPDQIRSRITKRTKAILIVHLYGHPCDMKPIAEIASRNGISLIEDCAEAHGAEYCGKMVGSFGDVSCFSFYGNKIITTGEGGMCATNDSELDEKMRILRGHGMSTRKPHWPNVLGYNYRMTNVQAALGLVQLRKIGKLIEKKRKIAAMYKNLLQTNLVAHPPEMTWAKNVFWLYTVLVSPRIRNNLVRYLGSKRIETRPCFHPIHKLPPHKQNISLPIAEGIARAGLSLPSGPDLSESDVQEVATKLVASIGSRTSRI